MRPAPMSPRTHRRIDLLRRGLLNIAAQNCVPRADLPECHTFAMSGRIIDSHTRCDGALAASRNRTSDAGHGSDTADSVPIRDDYLEGAPAIAAFLGDDWNKRRVYRARDTGALPIRRRPGIGLYAFRSELE